MHKSLIAALFLSAPAIAEPVKTDIINNAGAVIGSASFSFGEARTLIRLELSASALSPGWHGVHLHAVGDCSDTAGFKASGAHANHSNKVHGLLNPAGADDGDLPNLYAAADGSAHAEMGTMRMLAKDIRDANGTALVIHAAGDDHVSQPIGGAGPRVACAAIR